MMTAQATVLLVEDAPDVRTMISQLLEDEGYGVVARARAEEALDEVGRVRPDLVILDLRLPGMSGQECLGRLRESASTASLPVLLLSAAVDEMNKLAPTLDPGRTAVLAKPFDLDALLGSVHALLTPSRA